MRPDDFEDEENDFEEEDEFEEEEYFEEEEEINKNSHADVTPLSEKEQAIINYNLHSDIYGNPTTPETAYDLDKNLQFDIEQIGYKDEHLKFDHGLYNNNKTHAEFARFLETQRLTPGVRSMLMNRFIMETGDDTVLGNYTPHEARIVIEELSLSLEMDKLKLRGKDMLSWIWGDYDAVAKEIISAAKKRINRGILGWERTALITQRTYSKVESLNEEKNYEDQRNKNGVFGNLFSKNKRY